MKLKKSLLAFSTAATVALAGTGAAVAEETPDTAVTQEDTSASSSSDDQKAEGSSADDFFGWNEDTTGADKYGDVTGIIGKSFEFLTGIFSSIGKIIKVFIPFV